MSTSSFGLQSGSFAVETVTRTVPMPVKRERTTRELAMRRGNRLYATCDHRGVVMCNVEGLTNLSLHFVTKVLVDLSAKGVAGATELKRQVAAAHGRAIAVEAAPVVVEEVATAAPVVKTTAAKAEVKAAPAVVTLQPDMNAVRSFLATDWKAAQANVMANRIANERLMPRQRVRKVTTFYTTPQEWTPSTYSIAVPATRAVQTVPVHRAPKADRTWECLRNDIVSRYRKSHAAARRAANRLAFTLEAVYGLLKITKKKEQYQPAVAVTPTYKSVGAAAANPNCSGAAAVINNPQEGTQMERILQLLGDKVTFAAGMRNNSHRQPTLGYALGICTVYMNEAGHLTHGNAYLPVNALASDASYYEEWTPVSPLKSHNHTSFVMDEKNPVFAVRANKLPDGAGYREAMSFFSSHWNRAGVIIQGAPQLTPSVYCSNAAGEVVFSNYTGKPTGNTEEDKMNAEVYHIRESMKINATVGNDPYKVASEPYLDGYGNEVYLGTGLNIAPGTHRFFFIADVWRIDYATKRNMHQPVATVMMKDGKAVGGESLVPGCTINNNGEHHGETLSVSRWATNDLRLFTINSLEGVMYHDNWDQKLKSETKPGLNKGLWLHPQFNLDLARLFNPGHPALKATACGRPVGSEKDFNHKNPFASLMDFRSNEVNFFFTVANNLFKGNAVNKKVIKHVAKPVLKRKVEEEVKAITITPSITGAEIAAATAAARNIEVAPSTPPAPPAAPGQFALELREYVKEVRRQWVTHQPAVNAGDFSFEALANWTPSNFGYTDGVGKGKQLGKKPKGALAAHRYLLACTGADHHDYTAEMNFGGVEFTVHHVVAFVEIIRSYLGDDQKLKDKGCKVEITAEGYCFTFFGDAKYYYIEGVGMLDHRGRLFKNVLQVNYSKKSEKSGRVCTNKVEGINSVGSFLRFLWLAYLPILASDAVEETRMSSNLNIILNKMNNLIPLSSDEVEGQNAKLTFESNAWIPTGRRCDLIETDELVNNVKVVVEDYTKHAPSPLAKRKDGVYNFHVVAGTPAAILECKYRKVLKDAAIEAGDLAASFIALAMEQLSFTFSFNKGEAYCAPGFFTDLRVLHRVSPLVYGMVMKHIAADSGYENAAVMLADIGLTEEQFVNTFLISTLQKKAKGTKRALLRAPLTSVQGCGSLVDMTARPKLREWLATHGMRYENSFAARNTPPDFMAVRYGAKILGQQYDVYGCLTAISLATTGVGPAGVAVSIGSQWKQQHIFNGHQHQASLELAARCAPPARGTKAVAAPECPVVVNAVGCVLSNCEYQTYDETRLGTVYHYFKPLEAVQVHGDGASIICEVLTNDGPNKIVTNERANADGTLDWICYHLAPGLTTIREVEISWQVTDLHGQAKIRSSVKAQILCAKPEFLYSKLNPDLLQGERLVDCIYPNDAFKGTDLTTGLLGIIGATLVNNPDCEHREVLAMREMMADINEYVEGRRHYKYLIEDTTAHCAVPLYLELQARFKAFFERSAWYSWMQLETGDFGAGVLRTLQQATKTPVDQTAKEVEVPQAMLYNLVSDSTTNNLRTIKFADGDTNNINTNVFVFKLIGGVVYEMHQRCHSITGRDGCKVYDVVLFECATNKEGVNSNPSGQMDVNLRSLQRDLSSVGGDAIADLLMREQAAAGTVAGMYQTKMLVLMNNALLSQAMNDSVKEEDKIPVLNLGSWVNSQEKGKGRVWSPNLEAVDTLKQLVAKVDMKGINWYGELCAMLRGYVFRIENPTQQVEEDDYSDGYFYTTTYKEVWTPFLYNMNGLRAENNSHSTISGFFSDIITGIAYNAPSEKLIISTRKFMGMLDSLASNSESIRKFISGDEVVGAKVLAMPHVPSGVLLVEEHSTAWQLMAKVAKRKGHDLANVPTFSEYKRDGDAVWDDAGVAETFGHLTRSPLSNGPVLRTLKMPVSSQAQRECFYCLAETSKAQYVDGVKVGNRVTGNYPFTFGVGVVTLTGYTGGDSDGDGVSFAIICALLTTKHRNYFVAAVATFEAGWNRGEEACGGEGMMVATSSYLGDHLLAPPAGKKLAVWHQRGWFNIKTVNKAALVSFVSFNEGNANARVMQTTFVGTSYFVYRMAEAIVSIVRSLRDAGVKTEYFAPSIQWALNGDAKNVVDTLMNLYEIILGATDDDGWAMYVNFYQPAAEGKFERVRELQPFHTDLEGQKAPEAKYLADRDFLVNGVKAVAAKPATATTPAVAAVQGVLGFREATTKMGGNGKYATECVELLSLISRIKVIAKAATTVTLTKEAGPKRTLEMVLLLAYMSVETGRAKWSGFQNPALNAIKEACPKVTNQAAIRRIIVTETAANTLWAKVATRNHLVLSLMTAFEPHILGDLCHIYENADKKISYTLTNAAGERPLVAYYEDRLIKRVGDIVPPVLVPYVEAEELDELNEPLMPPAFDNYADYDADIFEASDEPDFGFYDNDVQEEPDYADAASDNAAVDDNEVLTPDSELDDNLHLDTEDEFMPYDQDYEEFDENLNPDNPEEGDAAQQELKETLGITASAPVTKVAATPQPPAAPVVTPVIKTAAAPVVAPAAPVAEVTKVVAPVAPPVINTALEAAKGKTAALLAQVEALKAAKAAQEAEAKAAAELAAELELHAALEAEIAALTASLNPAAVAVIAPAPVPTPLPVITVAGPTAAIYTAVSCKGDNGAYVALNEDKIVKHVRQGTNSQQLSVLAATEALKLVAPGVQTTVYTNNTYVTKGVANGLAAQDTNVAEWEAFFAAYNLVAHCVSFEHGESKKAKVIANSAAENAARGVLSKKPNTTAPRPLK